MGTVIPFPGSKLATEETRLCGQCIHAYLGVRGVYCGEWKEEIWDERTAEDCEAYDL